LKRVVAGGVAALSAVHEAVSAHLGTTICRWWSGSTRSSRSGLFDLLNVLVLEPTSTERGVLDTVRFLRVQRAKTGESLRAASTAGRSTSGLPLRSGAR